MQRNNEWAPEDEPGGAIGLSELVLCTLPVIVDHSSCFFLSPSQILTYRNYTFDFTNAMVL